jgi:hypothetical protein
MLALMAGPRSIAIAPFHSRSEAAIGSGEQSHERRRDAQARGRSRHRGADGARDGDLRDARETDRGAR